MGKRKPTGELKTLPLPLQVHRNRDLHQIRAQASNQWNVDHIQPFFPSLETMFKTDQIENVREHGIKLDEPIQSILSSNSILTPAGTKQIHIKQTMILSPLKWMRGDYGGAVGLPTSTQDANEMHEKIQSSHNAAYVGSLFSAVFSQTGCIHFPKVYGVYTGISKKHTIDISDDYPELMDRPWFSQNIGKTFELRLADHIQNHSSFSHTRNARLNVQLTDEIMVLDGVNEVTGIDANDIHMPDINPVFSEDVDETDDNESDSSSVSTSYVFDIRSCDCSEIESCIEDEEEEDEGYAWATLSNVPVQITVMEQCEGTLYQLMCLNPETEKHMAWLSQVLFALCFAQRTLGYTHNDLHSNNIMYVKTDKEFLWYKVDGHTYKIPTYGYIIKIIDFERGVGSVRVAGMKQPKTFVSDHFSPDEEAGGQYNIEPFYVSKYETIKPNPSFDLVRLATSLFWDLFPNGPKYEEYSSNPIFQVITRWMTLDDGTSVLFGKKKAKHDRFHGFQLYKAIARLCKDSAIPRKEIQKLQTLYGISSPPNTTFDLIIA